MTARVDARGLRCPWPALRLAAAMRTADEAVVLFDDPIAPREIAALAELRGWRLSRHNGHEIQVNRAQR